MTDPNNVLGKRGSLIPGFWRHFNKHVRSSDLPGFWEMARELKRLSRRKQQRSKP